MKGMMRTVVAVLCISMIGCASSTTIHTTPEKAKVIINNSIVGETPYDHWDRDGSYEKKEFTLVKEGYKEMRCTIEKNVLYVHRLFFPPLLALPWLYGYQESYNFMLKRIDNTTDPILKIDETENNYDK